MGKHPPCKLCAAPGKRTCPAINAPICARCCASQRGIDIACAADCPHNPYAPSRYERWIELDGIFINKALRYASNTLSEEAIQKAFARYRPLDESDDDPGNYLPMILRCLLTTPLPDRPFTLAEQWMRDARAGLTADDRIMLQGYAASAPTILELRRRIDHQSVEALDMLAPEEGPLCFVDRSLHAYFKPYERLLCWTARFPHYRRVLGAAKPISFDIFDSFMEQLRDQALDAGTPPSPQALVNVLAEEYIEAFAFIDELSTELWQHVLRNSDLTACQTEYRMTAGREAVLAVLNEKPDFEPDGDSLTHWVWLRRGEARAIEKADPSLIQHPEDESRGVGVLGQITLTEDRLQLETFGRKKLLFAKSLLERYFGKQLDYLGEVVKDLGLQKALQADEDEDEEEAAEPEEQEEAPALSTEEEKEVLEAALRLHYEQFMDDAIPALAGMTPREAANNPAMRSQLVELMKRHVNGLACHSATAAADLNINWVLDELGLTELVQS